MKYNAVRDFPEFAEYVLEVMVRTVKKEVVPPSHHKPSSSHDTSNIERDSELYSAMGEFMNEGDLEFLMNIVNNDENAEMRASIRNLLEDLPSTKREL